MIYDEQAQTTVQISGRLEMINDPYEQKAALDNMFASSERLSHRPTPPIDKIESGEYVVLQLLPVVIKLARYGHVESDDDDELYETLLFTEA